MLQTLLAGRENSKSPTHRPLLEGVALRLAIRPSQPLVMLRRNFWISLCFYTPSMAQQNSPAELAWDDLSPRQFGIPDLESELRGALGHPLKTTEDSNGRYLKYPGITVWTNGDYMLGAAVTSRTRPTRRGLRVTDGVGRVLELYGPPTSTYVDDARKTQNLIYQIDQTAALTFTVRSGRVSRITAGAIYD
jgi:hypothetical protein